jgi:predicted nucleic-acid-binding protein
VIGLDTNVLLRYLLQDDEIQGARAAKAIREAAARNESLLIAAIVLCEAVWVLERAYGYDRAALGRVVDALLDTKGFEIEHRAHVREALDDFRSSTRADFSDCLIGRVHDHLGCRQTLTFDRSLRSVGGFRVL